MAWEVVQTLYCCQVKHRRRLQYSVSVQLFNQATIFMAHRKPVWLAYLLQLLGSDYCRQLTFVFTRNRSFQPQQPLIVKSQWVAFTGRHSWDKHRGNLCRSSIVCGECHLIWLEFIALSLSPFIGVPSQPYFSYEILLTIQYYWLLENVLEFRIS